MITPRVLADSAKTHIVTCSVGEVEAKTVRIPFMRCPKDITIVEVGVLPDANGTIVSAGGTLTIAKNVEGGTDVTIAALTTTGTTNTLAARIYKSLGSISNADRLEGDVLTYTFAAGAATTIPALTLQLEYVTNEVI